MLLSDHRSSIYLQFGYHPQLYPRQAKTRDALVNSWGPVRDG